MGGMMAGMGDTHGLETIEATAVANGRFRYFDLVMAAFVAMSPWEASRGGSAVMRSNGSPSGQPSEADMVSRTALISSFIQLNMFILLACLDRCISERSCRRPEFQAPRPEPVQV